MPKRRNRSLDPEQSGAVSEAQDDLNSAAIHDAYLGTIAVDVRNLDTDTYESREIDPAQVANLKESFKKGIRRFSKETRMRASMTQADYDLVLHEYVSGGSAHTRGAIVQARIQATNTDGDKIEDFVYLQKWPEDLKMPSLFAGHHRKEALVTVLEEKKRLEVEGGETADGQPESRPGIESYFWAIDVYDTEKVQGDMLASLKRNRDGPCEGDSDGYILLQILTEMDAKSYAQKKKLLRPINFGPWVQTKYGMGSGQPARILTILRSEFWTNLWSNYVRTPNGQRDFCFSTATEIISTKLEFLWEREIMRANTFKTLIFGKQNVEPSPADWEIITQATKKVNKSVFIRRLFFPCKQDSEEGALTGDLQLNDKWFTEWSLPQLQGPFSTGTDVVHTRRPGFLINFDDQQYQQAFINLTYETGLSCPSWDDIVQMNRFIAQPMKKILQHIIYWIDQSFVYPNAASRALKSWDWLWKLECYVFNHPLSKGEKRPWRLAMEASQENDDRVVVASVSDHVQTFMTELWSHISEEPLWHEMTALQAQLPPPVDKKWNSVDEIVPEALVSYMSRFGQKNWAAVVRLVVEHAGPVLTGPFSKFNDLDYFAEHLQPSNIWGSLNLKVQSSENPRWQAVRLFSTATIRQRYIQQIEISSAMFAYLEIKKVMVETLKKGYGGGAENRTDQAEFILDKAEWDKMMSELSGFATVLNAHGFNVNIDRIDEPLSRLSLNPNATGLESSDSEPMMGFVDTDPEKFKNSDTEIGRRNKKLKSGKVVRFGA